MATFAQVDPETFVKPDQGLPPHGRGAWTRLGIGGDYRYHLRVTSARVGNEADRSLDHWAVSAGVWAIQHRLEKMGYLPTLPEPKRGSYGWSTRKAVKAFQNAEGLKADGIVGRGDAFALFHPVVTTAQHTLKIPDNLLRGIIAWESLFDPGAIGYYIFNPEFKGVDRGLAQINSKANYQISWIDAYRPWTAALWSAERLRATYERFRGEFPQRSTQMLWDATVCSHNSPARAYEWLRSGEPSYEASLYVEHVKGARTWT